jgi:hypothetical protein
MPGPWTERAACRGRTATMALPDLQPRRRTSRRGHLHEAQRVELGAARAICATCAVVDECAAWALAYPDPAVGMVAAGMTPSQRRDARNERREA